MKRHSKRQTGGVQNCSCAGFITCHVDMSKLDRVQTRRYRRDACYIVPLVAGHTLLGIFSRYHFLWSPLCHAFFVSCRSKLFKCCQEISTILRLPSCLCDIFMNWRHPKSSWKIQRRRRDTETYIVVEISSKGSGFLRWVRTPLLCIARPTAHSDPVVFQIWCNEALLRKENVPVRGRARPMELSHVDYLS